MAMNPVGHPMGGGEGKSSGGLASDCFHAALSLSLGTPFLLG